MTVRPQRKSAQHVAGPFHELLDSLAPPPAPWAFLASWSLIFNYGNFHRLLLFSQELRQRALPGSILNLVSHWGGNGAVWEPVGVTRPRSRHCHWLDPFLPPLRAPLNQGSRIGGPPAQSSPLGPRLPWPLAFVQDREIWGLWLCKFLFPQARCLE